MVMISIEIQDERGRQLQPFDDADILASVLSDGAQGTSCLRFIDPYGNTVFNQLQIPLLTAELRAKAAALPGELRTRTQRLADFIAAAANRPHVYIKFIGD